MATKKPAKKATAKKTAAKKPAKKATVAKKAVKKAPVKKVAKKAVAKKKPAVKRKPNAAFMKAMNPSATLAAVIGSSAMPGLRASDACTKGCATGCWRRRIVTARHCRTTK